MMGEMTTGLECELSLIHSTWDVCELNAPRDTVSMSVDKKLKYMVASDF